MPNLEAVTDGAPEAPQETAAPSAPIVKRQTVVTAPGVGVSGRIQDTFQQYAKLGYYLPFELLEYIELVARYNPDYSQAVENIKTLANSGHELFVSSGTKGSTDRIKSRLEDKARTIQASHGGVDGIIDKLLNQAATFGAMCGEWVVNDEMTDVVDFADISPKTIRFFWEDNHWAPYQKVTGMQAKEAEQNGQKTRNGNCVKLNETTFHYFAFDAAPNSPYGTPPFIAALRNISIQDDMVENMARIVKKIGLLGMVDLKVERLQKVRGETEDQYMARAQQFLSAYAEIVEDMVREGGIAHFDDAEIDVSSISGNASGATNIFKQNEEQIFSGLKSMPSVQGRSYSTTETYAGVAYDIIIRNTHKYQRAVKRMIENGYWMMNDVWGERATAISIKFNPNKSLHRLQNSQARLLEIKNGLMMWATGIWDQSDFAMELGESEIKTQYDEIPEHPILGNTSPGGGAGATSTDDQVDDSDQSSDS